MAATARINRVGYIGLRGIAGCEVLEIHPQLTALIGPAGTGKSTLLMYLTYALLPDRRTLEIQPISQLEDTHLTGQDTLIGRMSEEYGYAYVILDITTRHAQRLLAGIHVESIEGRASFTPWLVRNPPADVPIQELFAVQQEEAIHYPDLPDLKRHFATQGYDLTTCRTVGEYGQVLYDAGILPGPMLNQEERTQYAHLLEATFQGGISTAITKRLKEYLLPAQTQVNELIQGIRECTSEVFKTRRAVAEAARDLTRLQLTYGAGRQAVLAALQQIDRDNSSTRETIQSLTSTLQVRRAREQFLGSAIPSLKTEIETAHKTKEQALQTAVSELETARLDQESSAVALSQSKRQLTECTERLKLFREGETVWKQLVGDRPVGTYDELKATIDHELEDLHTRQAQLKQSSETLREEDKRLQDQRASLQSERLARHFHAQPLGETLATLSTTDARAMELTLGQITEGAVGADLEELKALTPSPELPSLFWIGKDRPQILNSTRVGEWEAASMAGGFLVRSLSRLPIFSNKARQQRRETIATTLEQHAVWEQEHGRQIQAVKQAQEQLLKNHQLLHAYLEQQGKSEELERQLTEAEGAHEKCEAAHTENRTRYTEIQSKLATLQQPYERQISSLRDMLRAHEMEHVRLFREIEGYQSTLSQAESVATVAAHDQQCARESLGDSFEQFMKLAEAQSEAQPASLAVQHKRIQEVMITLGDELTQRYESFRQVSAVDRVSIIRIWPDLMTIIRDTVNTALADMEGEDLINAMQRQRAELDATLLRQEDEVRINARNIHLNITSAIRAQRSRIEKLSKFGTRLEFGNVTGIRISLTARKPLLEILDQFADQLSLFTNEKPIDAVLQDFFAAAHSGGLKTSSEQLLDYRFYVDLVIEARRHQGEWEPASALSGTESIGCGLAIALMLVRSIAERQESHGEKVKVTQICPVFAIDEASRVDAAAQRVLVEFGRRERFQLIVSAPELTPTYTCTLYALKREFLPVERLIIRGVRVKPAGET